MGYKLFLDDIRSISMIYPNFEEEFILVRTFNEFVEYIQKMGLPEFISFDNDLGCNENGELLPEGYDAAKWLVYESNLDISELKYAVHSSNPVAKVNIKSLLDNYIRHLKTQ